MYTFFKFLHLVAAILWLGGMGFMLLALRPALGTVAEPPSRLRLLAAVLRRFFAGVWAAIALLLLTGGYMYSHAGAQAAPLGWHLMGGIGVLMFLVYAHLYFTPYQRLRRAVDEAAWPQAASAATMIARLAGVNFALGWLAVAAITFLD